MALTNYTDLQTSIAAWMHRTDLTAIIPDFITLAEKRINGDLNARLQDTIATLTTVAGSNAVGMPSDAVDIRSLVVQSSPNSVLNYLTPDQFNKQYAYQGSGTPRSFAVIGGSIYLGPIPDQIYSVLITYRASLPPLAINQT